MVRSLAAANEPHTRIHRDYWHKRKSLEHGCCSIAAAILLYAGFVTERLSGCIKKQTHTVLLDRLVRL